MKPAPDLSHCRSRTDRPLVSVCMVTYNHEEYLAEAIEGVLMQKTSFGVELCLGEDCSTDGTRKICEHYAKAYPDIVRLFLREEKDKIYISGRKTGRFNTRETLKSTRGRYVAMCEGDDYWTDPDKLQKQVDFLEANPKYSACVHRARVVSEDPGWKEEVFPEIPAGGAYRAVDALEQRKMFAATASLVFRRMEMPESEWTNHCFMGDRIIFAMLTARGPIAVLPDVMSVYRRHDAGAAASFMRTSGRLPELRSRMVYFENIQQLVGRSVETDKMRVLMLRHYARECFLHAIRAKGQSLGYRWRVLCLGPFRMSYVGSLITNSGRFREIAEWVSLLRRAGLGLFGRVKTNDG